MTVRHESASPFADCCSHPPTHPLTHPRCSAQIQADRIFEDVAESEVDRYDAMHREAMGEMFSEMSYGDQVFQNKLFTGEEELFASVFLTWV